MSISRGILAAKMVVGPPSFCYRDSNCWPLRADHSSRPTGSIRWHSLAGSKEGGAPPRKPKRKSNWKTTGRDGRGILER